jgi:opacity protein-like surface antigen
MKKFLLGAAAALAIAAPGVAAAQSGYVDLGYASADGEVLGADVEGEGWQAGGAVAFNGTDTLGVQLDALVGESEDTGSYLLGGHLYTRNEGYLFGGFANLGNVDPDGGTSYDAWSVGLETQWYLDRTTFDGVLSYSDAEDLDTTYTALDLGATHFVTDNFSFGGNVGFGTLDVLSVDLDTVTYGLGAEYQFASAPISIFGGWDHLSIDDVDTDQDTLSVGVRYSFGSGSLFERNRSGASLQRDNGLARIAGAF